MNEKNLKLLNDFANNNTLAVHIKVDITEHQKSFKPRKGQRAYYEECNLLADMIRGAEQFLYYLERNGYDIKRKKKVG